MSRNKEKAHSGLNRYYEQKLQDAGAIDLANRPRKVQSVRSLADCERWRKVVMGEFSANLAHINNPSLSDGELRSLNDALNRLFREKRAWEHHIFSLGGNDHIRYDKPVGVRVGNTTFYGRAKDLPEARKEAPVKTESASDASLDYYGFYDPKPASLDASRERVRSEFEHALGSARALTFDQRDVEKWAVERRKKELMEQLLAAGP